MLFVFSRPVGWSVEIIGSGFCREFRAVIELLSDVVIFLKNTFKRRLKIELFWRSFPEV